MPASVLSNVLRHARNLIHMLAIVVCAWGFACSVTSARAADCNTNGQDDGIDINFGDSKDCNINGTPDECEPFVDCNTNGQLDACDVSTGSAADCNANQVPDECDLAGGLDCNTNGTVDLCEIDHGLTYAGTTIYGTGFSPNSARLADINGDGILDMVIPAYFQIVVRLGHGDGTFDDPYNPTQAGLGPVVDLVLVDMNTDGALDIVVICGGDNTVEVLTNDGFGDFASAAFFATGGTELRTVIVGNFNEVGLPDIAVLCRGSNKVEVYANNNMVFSLSDVRFGYPDSQDMVAGDFNEDGHLDLAVSLFNTSEVIVAFGDGMGAFPSNISVMGGSTPIGIDAADINNDTHLDLITADFNGPTATVLYNDGTANFTATSYPTRALPIGIAAGDMDGDGLLDIIICNIVEGDVEVLTNASGFDEAFDRHVGDFPLGVSVADLNTDGRLDIAVANANSGNIAVLIGEIGTGPDADSNGLPDECGNGQDCNTNGTLDIFDIANFTSGDCNTNNVPDECDLVGITPLSQWASYVIDFSTEWGNPEWAAAQALGVPDTFDYGDFSSAWSPSQSDGTLEFITVGFSTPVYASGATIRETDGNGFVYQVDVVDTNDILHTVWTGSDPSLPGNPVNYAVNWPTTAYLVKGVKVYVDTDHNIGEFEEIDAIALHGNLPAATGDCNTNGTPDECDVANFISEDCNGDNIPDECFAGGLRTFNKIANEPIEDNATLESVMTLPYNSGTVLDVNVRVNIQHTYDADLDIYLSKEYRTVLLVAGAGGDGHNYTNTLFDDQAPDSIYSGSAPFTGDFQPNDQLSGFINFSVNGDWTLTVRDGASGDTGTLKSWALFIDTQPVDCDTNGVPDNCEFHNDCDFNGIPDECELLLGRDGDCNTNGVPDRCDLEAQRDFDCNTNGAPDLCDIDLGETDCDTNGQIDLCELDCNTNAIKDICEVAFLAAADCNTNGFPDSCDIPGFINLAPRVGYQAGSNPTGYPGVGAVVAYDVDNDGDMDLIASDGGSQDVTVLRNNGAGIFGAPEVYTVGASLGELTVGDFDGVNGPDIAVLDNGNDRIQILLNNGAGVFTLAGNYSVGITPQGLKTADLNNDGKLDLVAGNNGDHTISVLRGNGDGTFQAQVVYPIFLGGTALDVADMNGDNRPDIVVTFFSDSPTLAILFNDGVGGFAASPFYYGGASTPYSVVLADMDGDGDNDIVTANFNGGDVTIFWNDGAGTLILLSHFPTAPLPLGLGVGDLNGDGRLDIVSGEWSDVKITVLRNDGLMQFTPVLRTRISTYPTGVAIAKFNGDTLNDIAVGNINGPATTAITVHMNTSQSALADANSNSVPDVCEAVASCATCKGDMDGDNKHDGKDVNAFVACLFNGPGIGGGCACADMNGDNQINATDIGLFATKLLTGSTTCP